jgi:hypothetical protein
MVKEFPVLKETGESEAPEDMVHCTAAAEAVADTTEAAAVALMRILAAPMLAEAAAVPRIPKML